MASADQDREWVPRMLDLPVLLAKRSHLLLGPRQTGKTSLIRNTLTSSTSGLTLQGTTFPPGTPEFGEVVETLLMHELLSYRDYTSGEALGYWRSTSGFEVDFIIGDHTAVEVKAKTTGIGAGRQIVASTRRGEEAQALPLRVSGAARAKDRWDFSSSVHGIPGSSVEWRISAERSSV
jgi:predicted AAA+ superfamily ATPase